MEHINVLGTLRGKESRGALTIQRNRGQIPVSISGRGMEPVSLYISARDINRILLSGAGANALIDISFDGGRHVARLAQVDRHPIKQSIITVSLRKIAADESQKATIRLHIIGEPASVHDKSAILSVSLDHLEVRALPESMVASLDVDTSTLGLGDALRAGDIVLPDGFVLLTDPDTLVVALQTTAATAAMQDDEPVAEPAAAAA